MLVPFEANWNNYTKVRFLYTKSLHRGPFFIFYNYYI